MTLDRRAFLSGLLAGTAALAACGGTPPPQADISFERVALPYGADPLQSGDLTVPRRTGPHPVLVLIHGGYWQPGLDRTSLTPLGEAFARLGYAIWNVDYRTVGNGGGWTGTFDDIGAALDHVAVMREDRDLDADRVVTVGHSAGGQLALWCLARRLLTDPFDTRPLVSARGAVSFAGVTDLVGAATAPGGGNVGELRNAVIALLDGTPADVPERYALTSPLALLPVERPQLLVHGALDDRVPISQAQTYVTAAAGTGDPVRLIEVPTGDHGDVTRPDRSAWPDVVAWLDEVLSSPA